MTLDLKTANQSPCMTLWPMMLHHHTKSGYRRFRSWGDVRWTFTGILNLFCDLKLDHNKDIQSFHKTIHLMFSCKRFRSSDNILKCHIKIILSLTLTLILKTGSQSLWKTIWLIMMQHHTKFGSKRFSDSENIIWTNIHWHFEILLWPWPWTQHSIFSS